MSHTPRCLHTLILLAAAVLIPAASLSAATMEEIEKTFEAQFAKINSMSSDYEMVMDMSQPGFSNKTVSTTKSEMVRDGEKWKSRSETKSSSTMSIAGNNTKTESTTVMVSDGDFSYTVTDTNGAKSGMKMKADNKGVGGKGYFDALRESKMELKVLPEENVDGKATYVVEAKSKEAEGIGAMKIYIAKDTGFMLQMITAGPDGKPMSTMKMSNIKLNEPISADRFKFTPPPGVEMQDLTKEQK